MTNLFLQILTGVFRAIVNMHFIGIFFRNQSKPNIKNLFLILGFALLSSYSLINFDTLTIYFAVNAIFIFLFAFINSGILQRKLISATALLVFTILCDSFMNSAIIYIFKSAVPYYISNIIISSSIFIFASILNTFFNTYPLEEISFSKLILIICAPLSSLIVFLFNYIANPDDISTDITTFFLILLNVFIFYSYNIILKSANIENENRILALSNEAYKTQMDIISQTSEATLRLKHDINNHILSMSHLMKEKEYSKVIEHLNSITQEVKPDRVFSKTGNVVIDAIFNYKLSLINSLKAEISSNINLPSEDFMPLFDLTIIFGNLLDNVYEALQATNCKKFYLDITYDKGILYVNSKNTFDTKPIVVNKNYLTLKKDKSIHGFGIKNIEKVVAKYNGESHIKIKDNLFIYDLILFTKSDF